MAGSWQHMVKKSGKLRSPAHLVDMMDTPGDMIEALEECYGMVQVLAERLSTTAEFGNLSKADLISWAERNYRDGVHLGGSKTFDERHG